MKDSNWAETSPTASRVVVPAVWLCFSVAPQEDAVRAVSPDPMPSLPTNNFRIWVKSKCGKCHRPRHQTSTAKELQRPNSEKKIVLAQLKYARINKNMDTPRREGADYTPLDSLQEKWNRQW